MKTKRILFLLKDSIYIEAGKLGFFVRSATDQGFSVRFDDLAI